VLVHALEGMGKGMGHLAVSRMCGGGGNGFDKVVCPNKCKAKLFKFLICVDCHL